MGPGKTGSCLRNSFPPPPVSESPGLPPALNTCWRLSVNP